MADSVIDTTVLAFSNAEIAARRPGNAFDIRLRVLEDIVSGTRRLRYNSRLLGEYIDHVDEHRNDVIEMFFSLLDSSAAVLVRRNTLSRQHFNLATNDCNWPSHDQHLLAAAIDGVASAVFVTEERLACCRAAIKRRLGIDVRHV
jgi:hypothetical protein